jgi:putative methionine-R-sulfoxide reductase with GAF domain
MLDTGGKVAAVLDVDSSELAEYDDLDAEMLERLADLLARQDWMQQVR